MKKIILCILVALLAVLLVLPASAAADGAVAIVEGNSETAYSTLKSALAAVEDNQYIRLNRDVRESVTIPDGVLIDLAGNDLAGVTVSAGACFMDSTTDKYDGSLAGRLTPVSGTVQKTYKTTAAQAGAVKRYLAVKENGSYAFHRYYIGITKVTIKPGTVGVGYKASFAGSDVVKGQLSETTAYGYTMWLTEDTKITKGHPAENFGGIQEVTLRIDNYLDSELSDEENSLRANMPVHACAYIQLTDGTKLETDPVSYSFRDMLELANGQYTAFTEGQQEGLEKLSAQFSGSMISWDIHNIHHAQGSVWQSVTDSGFNALLQDGSLASGSYVLTENVDITTQTITISAGQTVNICLNSHTLSGAEQIFSNYGNLNICDCHESAREGSVVSALYVEKDGSNAAYGSVAYCYYDSVTNLYGGNLTATGTVTNGGVLLLDHDGADADKPAAVFNMYGGTISGGNTHSSGGNIALYNKSTFNLYDGSISGGNSGSSGGNIYSSGSTVNIHSGTIEGGTAYYYGGNIYSSGTVNMYTGQISGGTATTYYGGNVYTSGTMEIHDGSILGGTAKSYGGNIRSSGTLTIHNGTIEGGTANSGHGGNLYASSGTLNMYGGIVTGGYATGDGDGIYTNASTTISGDVYIYGNSDSNLYKKGYWDVNIENLGVDSKIGIAGDTHGVIYNDSAAVDKFSSDKEDYKVFPLNGKVLIMRKEYTPGSIDALSTFSVGYDMTSIMPTETGLVMSSWGNPNGRKTDGSVGYEIYATTVAITDAQNNTILMVTLDLQGHLDHHDIYRGRIAAATGVPVENIYLSATHTHNCPDLSSTNEKNVRYIYMLTDRLIESALDALADRAPATMKTGSIETGSMNFVRHYYYYKNNNTTTEPIYFGDNFGTPPQNGETIYHTHDGDHTMHLLAFDRGSAKKSVLLANWRAHPHRSGGMYKYSVDADVIGATRAYIHEKTTYLFAYFQGAAGDMGTTSRISDETFANSTAAGITEYGNELGRQIRMGIFRLKAADTGLIQTTKIVYAGPVDHSEDHRVTEAREFVRKYNAATADEQKALLEEYNFSSLFHAQRLITKYGLPATKDMELNIFSIGKSVGFYTAPAELWDTFSVEIEGISQFGTTFCIGYCNGFVAYIPYNLAYDHSYEDDFCLFDEDVAAPKMMEYYLEELQKQFENAK